MAKEINENKEVKVNKGNNKLFVKIMAGILAGLMLFSLCITPIAWLVSQFSK